MRKSKSLFTLFGYVTRAALFERVNRASLLNSQVPRALGVQAEGEQAKAGAAVPPSSGAALGVGAGRGQRASAI